ncbi:MAG: hypothetical protein AAF471_02800 [Myxococcota bacterium]
MTTESPEPNYEKLMLWTFITIFALLGFFTVYNHYFPEENKPMRPVPTRMQQKDSGNSDKAESPDAGAAEEKDGGKDSAE